MRIAIDAMGGDFAPQAVIDGLALALPILDPNTKLLLYGDEHRLHECLVACQIQDVRLSLVATSEVVGYDEPPSLAIRNKRDSSLIRAISDVAEGHADCVLSAGSTGALLTGATLIIKRLQGIKRPALATLLPTQKKDRCVLLLDCGANTDCKPAYLVQFALLGAGYMEHVMGITKPRIALLNNGTEEDKGNELTKAAHGRLKAVPLSFAGNCEARDVLSGDFDVVVCDGFDGNVLLKGIEGAAALMMTLLKEGLTSSLRGKTGAMLARPALRTLRKTMDYAEYGGAPLLGVNAGVVKAHGSSNGKAFCSAIRQCETLVASDMIRAVGKIIETVVLED